jgi:hypothetical protein
VKTAQSLNKAYAPSLILIGLWRGRDWVILVRHGALPPTRRAPCLDTPAILVYGARTSCTVSALLPTRGGAKPPLDALGCEYLGVRRRWLCLQQEGPADSVTRSINSH